MNSRAPNSVKLSALVELTDLTSITRVSDRCVSTVTLRSLHERIKPWLLFGEAQLQHMERAGIVRWRLSAYLSNGATDPEHDSAYAFRLPLVGLVFTGTLYQTSCFQAWVDAEEGKDFRVPRPGYNPLTMRDTKTCQACEEEHPIVPEGFYAPPHDADLYAAVAGKCVEIAIGVKA